MIRQLPTCASMRLAENLPSRDESTSIRDEHARHSDEPRAGAADSPRGQSAAGAPLILPGPKRTILQPKPCFLTSNGERRHLGMGRSAWRETDDATAVRHPRPRRRRHGPAAADSSPLRPAVAGDPARGDCARPDLLGAGLAVRPRARPPGRILALPRRSQHQLLVRLGTLHAADRLDLAAFPLRAPRPLAGLPRPYPVRPAVRVRAHRDHERRAALAGGARGQAVRLRGVGPAVDDPELRLGNDHLLGHRRAEPRRLVLPGIERSGCGRRSSRRGWSRRRSPRFSSNSTRTSCSTRCTRFRR